MKKLLLLLSMTAGLVAFAAPAAAQANGPKWVDINGTPLQGADKPVTIEGTGALASTRGSLTSGPCTVHSHYKLWNDTMANGIITFVFTASHAEPCPTSFSGIGCNLATVTNNTEEAEAWEITLVEQEEGNPLAEITNVTFTNRYTGCAGIGIPDGAPVMVGPGTLTGEVEGEEIVFVNSGDLLLGGLAVTVNGSIEIPGVKAQ